MRIYWRLLKHVRPFWKVFILAIFSMLILAATEPVVAALMKPMMDGTFVDKNESSALLYLVLIVLVFLVRGISFFGTSVCLSWVSLRVVLDLRMEMFRKLVTLPSSFFDRNPSGKIVSRITYDVQQVAGAASNGILILVRDSLSILGLVGLMFYLQWKLSLIILLVAPVIVVLMTITNRRLRRLSKAQQNSMGDITHAVGETIFANRVMKLYGAQGQEARRFGGAAERFRSFAMKTRILDAALKPLIQLLAVIALSLTSYFALKQTVAGNFSVGGFVSFFAAMGLLLPPIRRIIGVNQSLQQGVVAAGSVFGMIDQERESDDGKRILPPLKGEIEFRDLSFSYSEDAGETLRGMNFKIQPGQTVALVGASGAGKSTLIHLLARLYDPVSGSILLDGVDIREISLADLRESIAMVSQDLVLLNDTVEANITYGTLEGASPEKIEEAAVLAHAMEFIRELPGGMKSVIGDRGATLSVGQRQRLTIARAFLKAAPILILDEATSALDSTSEKYIQDAIEQLRKGRTSIVIAHRLSTIESADRILVLQEGTIVESGTHQELIARSSLYRDLYQTQLGPVVASDLQE